MPKNLELRFHIFGRIAMPSIHPKNSKRKEEERFPESMFELRFAAKSSFITGAVRCA